MQIRNLNTFWTVTLLALTACSGLGQSPTPTPDAAPAEGLLPLINATGVVVPTRFTTLSSATGGVVAELLVAESDTLAAGQPVLRLEGEERLQAAIATARLEVASAEYDLAHLSKDLELRLARAELAVVDARQALRDAERRKYNVEKAAKPVTIDQARANLVLARDRLEKAVEDFEPYQNKPEDNLTRAALLSVKAQAEQQYDQAVRTLNNLLAGANDLDVAEADSLLVVAQAQLEFAEREVETLKAGPDPEDVRLAEERLTNAKAQLLAAESALHDLEIVAPFAGTVSVLYIHDNQYIAPGEPVILLAELDHLRVETTDLNEIDVARVGVGSSAIVTFDALPDVSVRGVVTRIASKASGGSGVNYTVLIELDEIPPRLLWGMTAFVDIEVMD